MWRIEGIVIMDDQLYIFDSIQCSVDDGYDYANYQIS